MVPFDEECAEMARGIPFLDVVAREIFDFHAYELTEEGDILAVEKCNGLKGHSSFCPCRSCLAKGCRMHSGSNKVYYLPLRRPNTYGDAGELIKGRLWDSAALPLRTHKNFLEALEQISEAQKIGKKYTREVQQFHGIKHKPILSRVNSVDFARSSPWEWLHLFGTNIVPHMTYVWTGQFKNHDEGSGTYQLSKEDWAQIGAETAKAISHIPSDFVRTMGNIADDRSMYTAESYTFWFMYIAPHVLKGRFRDAKYYSHFLDLVEIMKATLLFEISRDDIKLKIEVPCQDWVAEYEE
ncbi:hypothetical protein BC629DRAFT_1644486 [Irpex lacteus]|nr:hypothetical protein BC629DRAFT_1644486 [Irpex lacteus]